MQKSNNFYLFHLVIKKFREKNILEENCLQDEKLRIRNRKNKSNLNNKI